MSFAAFSLAALLAWWNGAGPAGPPAPRVADQLSRLEGHRVSVAADRSDFTIDDVAGEGPPLVGVVVRLDEGTLALRTRDGRIIPLAGPLARPRIAGPGYKVWVIGDRTPTGELRPRRLGVLAPPWRQRNQAAAPLSPVE